MSGPPALRKSTSLPDGLYDTCKITEQIIKLYHPSNSAFVIYLKIHTKNLQQKILQTNIFQFHSVRMIVDEL